MSEVIYLPSTPFNLFLSLIDMLERQPEKAWLIMIDQKAALPYLELLQGNADFPLVGVHTLQAASGWKKPFVRRSQFEQLWRWVEASHPAEIVVGSDRRIEFQYLMHRFSQTGSRPLGVYLDDGLYSYLWWKHSRLDLEWWVNNFLKKVVYGAWWDQPRTIGDSRWVDKARLLFPAMARPPLLQKRTERIAVELSCAPAMQKLASELAGLMGIEANRLSSIRKLILLPHPVHMKRRPELVQVLRHELDQSEGLTAIKYHPRYEGRDPLSLLSPETLLLPNNVAYEFMLPLLSDETEVVGDLSTVMLSTKLLRPQIRCRLLSRFDECDEKSQAMHSLFEQVGVQL